MSIVESKEGTLKHFLMQQVKKVAYRSRFLRELSRPRYSYNIEPAQLAWLCERISETRTNPVPGCIVEVGVARGMTSVFLIEHLKSLGDHRSYHCIDTFSGFTKEDVNYEVQQRKKSRGAYGGFTYNDVRVFSDNLKRTGYSGVQIHRCDASQFDFSTLPPVDVMLLDVDLYLPTKAVLEKVQPYLNETAFIMVDDCREGGHYDGAHQAYHEFCRGRGFELKVIGNKGGVLEKRRASAGKSPRSNLKIAPTG